MSRVDWHELDRRYLASLKSMTVVRLRALRVAQARTYSPKWECVAVDRELYRRRAT